MSADLVHNLIGSRSPANVIQARLVARTRFFQINDQGERVSESFLFLTSGPQQYVDSSGEEWFSAHSRRIIELLDCIAHNSSNIEFDSIERVILKLVIQYNVDGQGVFPLPKYWLRNDNPLWMLIQLVSISSLLSFLCYLVEMLNPDRLNPESYQE